MKKCKLIASTMLVFFLYVLLAGTRCEAKTKAPYVVPQKEEAMNVTSYGDTYAAMSSYALYDDRVYIGFEELQPNVIYKVYRKEAKKKWKVIREFSVKYDNGYGFADKKLKQNTKYYYKLYSSDTGKYSKAEAYWTAAKHPTNVKQSGTRVTWKKIKNVNGYLIFYHKHYSFLDGYFTDDKYFCKLVSKNTDQSTIPKGYKLDGVYSYTKHNNGYYLGWAGIFSKLSIMKEYVGDGTMDFVLTHKKEFRI